MRDGLVCPLQANFNVVYWASCYSEARCGSVNVTRHASKLQTGERYCNTNLWVCEPADSHRAWPCQAQVHLLRHVWRCTGWPSQQLMLQWQQRLRWRPFIIGCASSAGIEQALQAQQEPEQRDETILRHDFRN